MLSTTLTTFNFTNYKDQDHYVILGLGRLRYKATKEDIRKACETYSKLGM